MLKPCKLAVVFDFCGFHCPDAEVPIGIARSTHPPRITATSFILDLEAALATCCIPTRREVETTAVSVFMASSTHGFSGCPVPNS
jgi:hypothetical protein